MEDTIHKLYVCSLQKLANQIQAFVCSTMHWPMYVHNSTHMYVRMYNHCTDGSLDCDYILEYPVRLYVRRCEHFLRNQRQQLTSLFYSTLALILCIE